MRSEKVFWCDFYWFHYYNPVLGSACFLKIYTVFTKGFDFLLNMYLDC